MDTNSQQGNSKFWIIVVVVIAVLLIGSGAYYWFSYRSKVTIGPDGNTMSVGENGTAVKPANFPKNIPVYPDATYDSFTTGPDGSSYGANTADSAEKITAWFNEQLPKNGWTVQIMNPNLISISAGDQVGNINVSTIEGKNKITFSVVPKSSLPENYDQIIEEQKDLLE
ncbi:MAG: hypothetical protein WCV58_02380 [Patescibacteria group bacterium]|jgi:hypothetical protein